MEAKIALCMIVKAGDTSELEHLRACLKSVEGYVDGIFINLNCTRDGKIDQSIRKVCNEFGAETIETVWENNFAKARNDNFAQVPEEFTHIIWLDTDDTVDRPQKIRKVCNASMKYDSVYVDYEYDHDEEGNPITVHMVARIVKNNGGHKWKGSIHETLVEQRSVLQGMTNDFVVVHHAGEERKSDSLLRNADMLEAQIKDEQNDPDPRTFYYLGNTYIDLGNIEAAKQLLSDYLNMSGWDQERCAAETKLGRLFLEEDNKSEAKKHFMLAIGEDPNSPEPRIEMGSLELEMKQFHKAQMWLEGVVNMEKNSTTLERNPMSYTFRTYLLLSNVYIEMGGKWIEKAEEYAKKALKFKKKDKNIRKYVKMIESIARDKDVLKSMANIARLLKKNKEEDKLQLLAQAAPKQLEDNPIIVKMREPKGEKWPSGSIAIMTGDTAIDPWGPWSLKEGIGGSEEAIIRLSKHLKDLGYRVVVFGKVAENAGVYDGVMWRNFWECNLEDEFDIFVAWRAPALFDMNIKARKKYLWLHDVMEPGEFTKERIGNFDKCIVLSDYHRSLFPMIPDEKILMSGNGIDPADLDKEDRPKRDPHKMVYTSSHVRGLAYIYEMWPAIKEEVPDATLDVYYGRESYDAINRGNPERIKWMDDMMAKAKSLDGVTDHGKVSQEEITKHIFESGLWVYPCPFPEVFCITAIKMQAGGAVPVSSDFAALDETVQFGSKIHVDSKNGIGQFDEKKVKEFKDKLVWWLKHPEEQEKERPKMMEWARIKSWRAIAEQWDKEFKG